MNQTCHDRRQQLRPVTVVRAHSVVHDLCPRGSSRGLCLIGRIRGDTLHAWKGCAAARTRHQASRLAFRHQLLRECQSNRSSTEDDM